MTNDGSLGGGLIKGWMDGMKQLRKGSKAKFFIPSPLGYGKQVAGNGAIPANSILIFEIEVTKVTSASIIRAERAKKMMEREAMRNKQDATNNDKKSPKTPQ
jgi:hypothetical protein